MAEDKKTLGVAEVLVHSQTLNTASQSLTDICNNMYDVITKLQENQSFKSKLASGEYYSKFDRLNGQVPKFTEGVLKFSKFLSGYLLDAHQEMDENTKQMVEQTLEESLSQLAAVSVLGGAAVDMTMISSTAQGAISGEGWIESSKINTEAFTDTGNLEFVTRDDGSIMITRNGVPIGFTTEEGIIKNESTASETGITAEANNTSDTKYMSQSEFDKLPLEAQASVKNSGYEIVSDLEHAKIETARAAGVRSTGEIPKENNLASTEGMGNNESIAKARENGTLPNTTPQYTESQKQYMENQNSEIENRVQNNENIQDSKWYTGIAKDVMSKRTDNQVTAINNETEKVLSGNGGLASEIIEKGSIPFPDNVTLSKPGLNLNSKSVMGNVFKELRYNENTGKIDVIRKDGSTYVSYDVDDLTSAKWK